jgi:hypothetical protein
MLLPLGASASTAAEINDKPVPRAVTVVEHRLVQVGAVCLRERRFVKLVGGRVVHHTRWEIRRSAEIKCGVPF